MKAVESWNTENETASILKITLQGNMRTPEIGGLLEDIFWLRLKSNKISYAS